MPAETVKIEGLKELDRAWGKYDKDLRRGLRDELKAAADIVAQDARHRASRYGSRTAAGIKPAVRTGMAVVRQSIGGKRLRPNFGGVLMRHSLLPAVEAKQGQVLERVERMLDRIGGDAGF